MVAEIAADPPGALLPVLALEAAAGDATAADAVELARRGLATRPLTNPVTVEDPTPYWGVLGALTVEGRDVADAALRDAAAVSRRGQTRMGRSFMQYARSEWALIYGRAEDAETAAREGCELMVSAGLETAVVGLRVTLARALVRQGRLDEAEAALTALPDLEHHSVAFIYGAGLGELRLAQGRPAEAVRALQAVMPLCAGFGWRRSPFGTPTAHLALALARSGERERAQQLAEAEIAEAQRRGTPMLEAEAGIALGHALGGAAALEAFAAAAAAAERSQALFTRASAHFEHGAALRRVNRPLDAREALAQARELAQRAGATALNDRATQELVLAGGRPRRTALTGVESLTPSERRIAEHAASGMTNREIAEALFITRKTVEYTLGRAYAKLDIKSRTQLAGLFD